MSSYIVRYLLNKSIISYEDKELYDYGIFIMMSYKIFFIISFLFGVVLKIPFSSVLFYVAFCLIRNFTGGIHAKSEIKCNILTTISILISIIFIKSLVKYESIYVAVAMLIMSSVSLCVIKPVASSSKKISPKEQLNFHKKAIMIILLILLISIISLIVGIYNIVVSLSIGVSLANILLILGKLQQKINKKLN